MDNNWLVAVGSLTIAAITLIRGYLMKPAWAPQSSLEVLRLENTDLHRNNDELRAQLAYISQEARELRASHQNCEKQLREIQRQYFELLRRSQ